MKLDSFYLISHYFLVVSKNRNSFVCILGFLLGTNFHKLLYVRPQRDLIWIKLLYISNEGIPQNLDRREKLIYRKTFSRSRIIYKILDLAIVSFQILLIPFKAILSQIFLCFNAYDFFFF